MPARLRSALAIVLVMAAMSFAGSHIPAAQTRTETSLTVQFFYDDLAPYGRWAEHRIYGTVWVPATGEPGWHPYVYGRWVWTADYGWYWDSDEEFGWATYHYGRWAYTTEFGWVWVPGDVWGPAWVDWRYGDGHVGWAPMPPEHSWRRDAGVTARIDLGTPGYAAYWVFVSEGDFARGDIRSRRMPAKRNGAMLSASVRVTNYTAINGRIVNRSIDPVQLSAATRVRINPVRIAVTPSLDQRVEIRATGAVPIFQPRVAAKPRLDLDMPAHSLDNSADVREGVKTWTGDDTDVRAKAGAAARGPVPSEFDRPIGGGIGIGGGAGIGGGLGGGVRIGR